jgi:hypothetical protein
MRPLPAAPVFALLIYGGAMVAYIYGSRIGRTPIARGRSA